MVKRGALAALRSLDRPPRGGGGSFFATPVKITSDTVYVASYPRQQRTLQRRCQLLLWKRHGQSTAARADQRRRIWGVCLWREQRLPQSELQMPPTTGWMCCSRAGPPPILTSIAVTPANSDLSRIGRQFIATGIYSDGSAQDIACQATWTSSKPGVATISTCGLITAVSTGMTTIAATLTNVVSTTTLTVQSAPLSIVATTSLTNRVVNSPTQRH